MYIPISGSVSFRYIFTFCDDICTGLFIQMLYVIAKDLEIIHNNLKENLIIVFIPFSAHICVEFDFFLICQPKQYIVIACNRGSNVHK